MAPTTTGDFIRIPCVIRMSCIDKTCDCKAGIIGAIGDICKVDKRYLNRIRNERTTCSFITFNRSIEHDIFIHNRFDLIELFMVCNAIYNINIDVDAGMMVATKFGHVDLIKILLKYDPNFNIKVHNGYFLRRATCCGQLNVVKYLVEELKFDNYDNAIVDAVNCGRTDLIDYLSTYYKLGDEIDVINDRIKRSNEHIELQKIKNDCNYCKIHYDHITASHQWLDTLNDNIVSTKHCIDIHVNDNNKQGIMIYACTRGYLTIIKHLHINHGKHVSINKYCVHMAVANGHVDVVEYMIENKINMSLVDSNINMNVHNEFVINYIESKRYFIDKIIKFVSQERYVYFYGGFVRDYLINRIIYNQEREFNDIDIWIDHKVINQKEENVIINRFITMMSKYCDIETLEPRQDYVKLVHTIKLTFPNGDTKNVDFVISNRFPVNDFNINLMTYDGMSFDVNIPTRYRGDRNDCDDMSDIPHTKQEVYDCIRNKVCYVLNDFYFTSQHSDVKHCKDLCNKRIEYFKSKGWNVKAVERITSVVDM